MERDGRSLDGEVPKEASERAEVCGALGCRDSPVAVVSHPDYGRRTLCETHALDLESRPPSEPGSLLVTPGESGDRKDAERRPERRCERDENRRPDQPTQGAEQRSEAPADAERPEAGACPPTRKPPRTPPTGGKGAIDTAGRCGAVVVAVAVYILHLRESTPRSDANHRERRLAGGSR